MEMHGLCLVVLLLHSYLDTSNDEEEEVVSIQDEALEELHTM